MLWHCVFLQILVTYPKYSVSNQVEEENQNAVENREPSSPIETEADK